MTTFPQPEILRAARCHLDWTRGRLAKESGVSVETIRNIEHKLFRPLDATLAKLVAVFEARGLEFIDQGVRKRAPCPRCGFGAAPAADSEQCHG
jgi:predicted transcriptional regulator